MHIFAANVQAKNGNRQMPPTLVEGQQLMPANDLAAPDAVGVCEHDVKGVDLGVGG